MKKWFWATFIAVFVVSIVTSLMGFDANNIQNNDFTGTNLIAALLTCAVSIFAVVISIMNCYRIAKVFGHGVGYTLGLIFLQNIFLLILGFGSSKYDKKLAKEWE